MHRLVAVGIVVLAILAGSAESFCCHCGHALDPNVPYCAATGGCNIFCCNCAGSCQKSRICKGKYLFAFLVLHFYVFQVMEEENDQLRMIKDLMEAAVILSWV